MGCVCVYTVCCYFRGQQCIKKIRVNTRLWAVERERREIYIYIYKKKNTGDGTHAFGRTTSPGFGEHHKRGLLDAEIFIASRIGEREESVFTQFDLGAVAAQRTASVAFLFLFIFIIFYFLFFFF